MSSFERNHSGVETSVRDNLGWKETTVISPNGSGTKTVEFPGEAPETYKLTTAHGSTEWKLQN
jgi:hypothetical protein